MSRDDAYRWNYRYQEDKIYHTTAPRELLQKYIHLLPKNGVALDIAMGLGRDACLLAQQGLTVYGVDISIRALRKAKIRCPQLRVFISDLENNPLPQLQPDVIVNFYYYQPTLIPALIKLLKPGGYFFFEVLTTPMITKKPDLNPDHLMESGKVSQYFSEFDIIHIYDGWSTKEGVRDRSIVQFIGKKRNS
jgi:SAM-dependent methyltransferase